MADIPNSVAYNKVTAPWQFAGSTYKAVEGDLSPAQMQDAAGASFKVSKIPAYAELPNGNRVPVGRSALVREDTWGVLDTVTHDWEPVQNDVAFEFFNDWCEEGAIRMETAGVMREGQIVWALAKTNDSFEVFRGDKIDSYILFANQHRYGFSTSVFWTALRVTCMNMFKANLSDVNSDQIVRVNHRREFIAEDVKEKLGISRAKLNKYKEVASFLGSKPAKGEDIVEYFKRIFPLTTTKEEKSKDLSRNAKLALETLEVQPGAEFARGTWWQPFNAVTFLADHTIGRNQANRLYSSWFGPSQRLKQEALTLATEFANAS